MGKLLPGPAQVPGSHVPVHPLHALPRCTRLEGQEDRALWIRWQTGSHPGTSEDGLGRMAARAWEIWELPAATREGRGGEEDRLLSTAVQAFPECLPWAR